jgi:hypothetical protein
VATATTALVLAPLIPTFLLIGVIGAATPKSGPAAHTPLQDRCSLPASFAPLARRSPGLTVGELDLGPYVLAATQSPALAAPYHRMTWGILTNQAILTAPDATAEARARAVGAQYVLECPSHTRMRWRQSLPPEALQRRLDQHNPPQWLEPLTPYDAPLVVYRVRPGLPGRGG